MRGLRNIYYHSYIFSFLLVFVTLTLFRPAFSISTNILSSAESLTITNNRTIVSSNGVFELGFLKPDTMPRWYLGIWYKAILERTCVWIANRDNPLSSGIGTLKISGTNLILLDQSDTPVWSTNLTGGVVKSPVVAELLSNGNFVVRYSNDDGPNEILWQSFNFPTDTLLPEMKLGWDRKTGRNIFLRSWRSPQDPSTGDFSFKLETGSLPEFFIWNTNVPMYRSGPWDGDGFNGIQGMKELDYMDYNFTESRKEVVFTFLMTKHQTYSRLTLSPIGYIQQFTWIPKDEDMIVSWFSPTDQCDVYTICGPNSYCYMLTTPLCNCFKGFEPKVQRAWDERDGSSGCVRKTPLSCGKGEGFARLEKVKLPNTTLTIVDTNIGMEECEKRCLSNCNCMAFAILNIRDGGPGCVMWTGDLIDIRHLPAAGQDLYFRLAAADLDEGRNISKKMIGLIIFGISAMLLLSFILFCFWRRKQQREKSMAAHIVDQEKHQELLKSWMLISNMSDLSGEDNAELELQLMEFETVAMATQNFSECNKLGQGGFGIVYKGSLLDGREIAVKRLSKVSVQGTDEFMNEVKLIGRLQHINLVRLLGCCINADEKMLIYEYLENLSLDSHLFDKTRSSRLDWQTRYDITHGIARGLLYLHQDSRFRIIHRDLKTSNILLDKDMTPKISDFGMARIFGRKETEANTKKVVGTYGYMSPEYAMDGIFSMKSDVFSFGVLLLELISGKRNKGFYNSNCDLNLLGCVWRNWTEGKGLEIVDPIIINTTSSTFRPHEILKCIQIGLLCVQERAEDRPMMSSVVLMLGSETTDIPDPKRPGYCVGRSPLDTDLSLNKQCDEESWTANQITVPVIDAR